MIYQTFLYYFRMNTVRKFVSFCGYTLLLSACQNTRQNGDLWTLERCIQENGLYIESPEPKCKIQELEYPIQIEPQPKNQHEESADVGKKTDGIIAALHDQHISFEPLVEIEDPLLGDAGISVGIQNEIVLVFSYPSDALALEEVQRLRSDGTTLSGLRITWGENVHYAQRGNEIAVYAGLNDRMYSVLEMAEQER